MSNNDLEERYLNSMGLYASSVKYLMSVLKFILFWNLQLELPLLQQLLHQHSYHFIQLRLAIEKWNFAK